MKRAIIFFAAFAAVSVLAGQTTFEESLPKTSGTEKPVVTVGADFAMQYQMLSHTATVDLIPLGKGVNLPTANLNVSALLTDGVEVVLTTYLSSRHHVEAWVKGGYLLIDQMPFLNSPAIDGLMDYLTLKAGVMEINYGDAHFRRSDNGRVTSNYFVGNYIIDAFTTAPAIEVLFRKDGIILMGAVSTGTLRPSLVSYNANSGVYTPHNASEHLAYYWKAGYDTELGSDMRLRATLSGYHAANHHFGSLYNGDRAGSRYYLVMNRVTNSPNDVNTTMNFTSGRWGPGFTDKQNSFMFNLLFQAGGAELFGTYETVTGTPAFGGDEFTYSQYAAEAIYRFGSDRQFYGGARYNKAWNNTDMAVNRIQAAAGWYITPNIQTKIEYVKQDYSDFAIYGDNAGFKGFMIEAAISF